MTDAENEMVASRVIDYGRVAEFDTGRFVARYLQILAWLCIAKMIVQLIFWKSFFLDVSPVFTFWAASALKRHSPTARKWVLGVSGLALIGLLLILADTTFGGSGRSLTISVGGLRIRNPAAWQIDLIITAYGAMFGIPFWVLLSRRAQRQFTRLHVDHIDEL